MLSSKPILNGEEKTHEKLVKSSDLSLYFSLHTDTKLGKKKKKADTPMVKTDKPTKRSFFSTIPTLLLHRWET